MAIEENNLDELTDSETPIVKKKSVLNNKVILFGIPLFVVQLVVVYFITANIILSKMYSSTDSTEEIAAVDSTTILTDSVIKPGVELGRYIYSVEDIIVNPSQTDGKRLLLTTVGFDLGSEEQKTELSSKEVLVKDIIISALSGKTLPQLNDNLYKDTLKIEIKKKVMQYIQGVKLNSIYFSKYIIQ